ncbi:MAG: nitronate monooxygenase, partial [Candidatus Rokuibacteriota bacterium]
MLRTRICELLGIEHPIILGGMASATSPELVAAVSAAGGLGVLGATRQSPEEVGREAAAIRAATTRPFGLNLLLFLERPGQYDGLLAARPGDRGHELGRRGAAHSTQDDRVLDTQQLADACTQHGQLLRRARSPGAGPPATWPGRHSR